jgi:hypothetical protein
MRSRFFAEPVLRQLPRSFSANWRIRMTSEGLRMGTAFLIFAFLPLPSSFPQDAPKADPPKPAESLKYADTVALDPEFIELYGDYALIRQEIERIETATGQVTIPQSLRDLSTRAQAKEKKIQVWIKAHQVGTGWILNWQDKRFEAPAKEQSAEKPKEKAEARSQK